MLDVVPPVVSNGGIPIVVVEILKVVVGSSVVLVVGSWVEVGSVSSTVGGF